MKFLVVLSVAVACVIADVSHIVKDDYNAPIVKSSYDITPEGTFQYAYETGNGIYAQAQGNIKNPNSEYPSLEINGGYKYVGYDGVPVELSYSAGDQGFVPVGSHIPVPPPIPEYILRSLAYIESHPPSSQPQKTTYQG